jgi:hypothetical protein
MKENTLVEATNATEAVQIVKDFMNYDITESVKTLMVAENESAKAKSEEVAAVETRIKFIEEKLSEVKAAEKVIGKSNILDEAKTLLEGQLAEQNTILDKVKYGKVEEATDADGFKPAKTGTEEKVTKAETPEAKDKEENFKPEEAPKGAEKTETEVEVKVNGDNNKIVVEGEEKTETEETVNEASCVAGEEYKIKGKPGYIYQGVADGLHIFNSKSETDPTPVHMKEEEFQAALSAGEITK